MWGLDLSGSEQGAGGVVGLLLFNDSADGSSFPAYDGNGNVVGLYKGSDSTLRGDYEYDPFGQLIRVQGSGGLANPIRFSSKYQDQYTDLNYYGYRYYSASLGRWVNRDPMEELLRSPQSFVASDHSDSYDDPIVGPLLFLRNQGPNLHERFGLWPSTDILYTLGDLPIAFPRGTAPPLTHENSISRSIPGDYHDHHILVAATLWVDMHQAVDESFMHAMSQPHESLQRARFRANEFVRTHLVEARRLLCKCPADRDQALIEFGTALHTIQDATSPAHTAFQTWEGKGHILAAVRHLNLEWFDPGPASALDRATANLWSFFRCGAAGELPKDFFKGLGHDPSPFAVASSEEPWYGWP
jgi:RHS repeat-associated protein